MLYDVIVVGAGPAGATAAPRVAQLGLQTLLVDKATFPRSKPCGGGVTKAALDLLDFTLPEEVIERRCQNFRSYFKEQLMELSATDDYLVLVTREKFDHFLLAKAGEAGAEIQLATKIENIENTGQEVKVLAGATSYRSRAVIGADGVYSKVARAVRTPFTQRELSYCITARLPLAAYPLDSLLKKGIEVYYGLLIPGYGWVFPKRDYLDVGFGAPLSLSRDLKKIFQQFLTRRGFNVPARFQAYSLPRGGYTREITANRLLLAGDAAGFVDPFTGEGIRYAIHSGLLAAENVAKAIKSGKALEKDHLAAYRRECMTFFGKDLQCARRLAAAVKRYPGLFFGVYTRWPQPFEHSLRLLTGEVSYRHAFRWFFRHLPAFLVNLR